MGWPFFSAFFSSEDFTNNPPVLELSGVFCEMDIPYSEEEYMEHLNESTVLMVQNLNYMLKTGAAHTFHNLQILIHEGQWVMVSKGNAPTIHFVIRHPKLRGAIDNFIPPVTEL